MKIRPLNADEIAEALHANLFDDVDDPADWVIGETSEAEWDVLFKHEEIAAEFATPSHDGDRVFMLKDKFAESLAKLNIEWSDDLLPVFDGSRRHTQEKIMAVFLLRIGNNELGDPYVQRLFSTKALATAQAAKWCRENWEIEPRFSGQEMPDDDQNLLDLWFSDSPNDDTSDYYEIEAMVIDDPSAV